MHQRVLIPNRGVIARRIVRACRKLGIQSVVCHSDLDAQTPAVEECDQAVRLPGYQAKDTYLNSHLVLETAKKCRADAIHPGYGFLAESSSFAEDVETAGISFIGPSSDWIKRMSVKTEARSSMSKLGIPVHEGSGLLQNEDCIRDFVGQVGLPIVLKPAAGGGGIGMFVVHEEDEIAIKFQQAQPLAKSGFADDSLYAEKYLSKPRHIEFQVVADGSDCSILGVRECSIQRRHQKLIEETPVPGDLDKQLADIEPQLTSAIRDYDSIGTVECLYDDGKLGFLEMNTRLQVEHGVTEEAHNVDLVALQVQISAGESLDSLDLGSEKPQQYAVEARLYAEDSERMLPSSGKLNVFRPVPFEGVRIEAGYRAGNYITPYYDPLLAKIIGTGSSREQAIARTAIALKAFEVEGVSTNSELLQNILGSEAFILGRIHTGLLEELHTRSSR
ncbi:MAG: biotin carboxylase [Gammaproteobacteria bacterium]|nr:biotin carboxylase [Gammaproteobacteria bacterium]